MKLGDLVRWGQDRYDDYHNEPGLVIKLYNKIPSTPGQGCPDRAMADILFPYGVVGDDTYEFEVVNETG